MSADPEARLEKSKRGEQADERPADHRSPGMSLVNFADEIGRLYASRHNCISLSRAQRISATLSLISCAITLPARFSTF